MVSLQTLALAGIGGATGAALAGIWGLIDGATAWNVGESLVTTAAGSFALIGMESTIGQEFSSQPNLFNATASCVVAGTLASNLLIWNPHKSNPRVSTFLWRFTGSTCVLWFAGLTTLYLRRPN